MQQGNRRLRALASATYDQLKALLNPDEVLVVFCSTSAATTQRGKCISSKADFDKALSDFMRLNGTNFKWFASTTHSTTPEDYDLR
ncbi:MAG TPA: hypothetical protein VD907_04795 [Verrucomicrobiae bacterium]|nr:hypothetical protein [Verrucomicrobiae bacterium]